jgi:hypothetical protein
MQTASQYINVELSIIESIQYMLQNRAVCFPALADMALLKIWHHSIISGREEEFVFTSSQQNSVI